MRTGFGVRFLHGFRSTATAQRACDASGSMKPAGLADILTGRRASRRLFFLLGDHAPGVGAVVFRVRGRAWSLPVMSRRVALSFVVALGVVAALPMLWRARA